MIYYVGRRKNTVISIKDKSVLYSLLAVEYDETLIDILMWLADEYPERIIITCGYRPGDKGVHGTIPCRGVDLRSRIFKSPDRVVNYINLVWEYDHTRPEKKVALFHDVGKGYHFHIQTHPNTRRKI